MPSKTEFLTPLLIGERVCYLKFERLILTFKAARHCARKQVEYVVRVQRQARNNLFPGSFPALPAIFRYFEQQIILCALGSEGVWLSEVLRASAQYPANHALFC